MFCDLVGSTALSEQLTPCSYLKVLKAYQELCTLIIQDNEGYVAQPLGDGLLVYFGYPFIQPDDATRAVKSALEIVIAIQQLEQELSLELAARVGIATGRVLMGKMGPEYNSEWLAIGVIPNIAARLQSLAASNSVVCCPKTYQLVSQDIDCQFLVQKNLNCQSLGERSLKGISKKMEVYQVST